MKDESKEGETSQQRRRGNDEKHRCCMLAEHVKVLLLVAMLALVMTSVLLAAVDRDELTYADALTCSGATSPSKCERDRPWPWGNQQGFGIIYSYRLLSGSIMAIDFLMFSIFSGLSVAATTSCSLPMFHRTMLFLTHVFLYIGLIYFMFAVEGLVHVKYPSYKPKAFYVYDETSGTMSMRETVHQPPYKKFAEVSAFFVLAFALLTFCISTVLSVVPAMGGTSVPTTPKHPGGEFSEEPAADVELPKQT